ncbi:hypothetical protein, partial [Pseudoalteromonas luteoviolacea]|uniref:hypothetical protein n=1 Tax=Pseudoalteromonas luteoviolacea TaxID=43657 RepID=UPI001E2A29C5
MQKVSDSERSEYASFAQGEVSWFSCCRGTQTQKSPTLSNRAFSYLALGNGPADGQRPRVQSVESETIHFPNPAFLVQRVND